jgi:hypothetical protein
LANQEFKEEINQEVAKIEDEVEEMEAKGIVDPTEAAAFIDEVNRVNADYVEEMKSLTIIDRVATYVPESIKKSFNFFRDVLLRLHQIFADHIAVLWQKFRSKNAKALVHNSNNP